MCAGDLRLFELRSSCVVYSTCFAVPPTNGANASLFARVTFGVSLCGRLGKICRAKVTLVTAGGWVVWVFWVVGFAAVTNTFAFVFHNVGYSTDALTK